jgi:hypothetical protein
MVNEVVPVMKSKKYSKKPRITLMPQEVLESVLLWFIQYEFEPFLKLLSLA